MCRISSTVLSLVLSLAVLFLLAEQPAFSQEQRTWTDSTGRFKIEARFKDLQEGKLTLERANGSELEIDVKKLSAADQKYVEELQAAMADNPFKPKTDENPFQEKPGAAPSSRAAANSPSAGAVARELKVDWASVPSVPLVPTQEAWKFQVPVAGSPIAELKQRGIPIPPKSNFFEGVKGFVVSATGQRALVGYGVDQPKPQGTTRLVLCELTTGKVLTTASTPGLMMPLALSDSGTTALMRRDEWGFGNHDRLELWKLTPSGIGRALQWTPNEDQTGGGRDISWAAFVDEDRVLTLGGNGRLALWNVATGEALYSLPIDGGCLPALTPDRRLLAYSTGKQLGVLDINAGEVLATQSTPHTPWPKLSFSPDASQLACLAHGKLYVWNFADGSLHREIPLTGLSVHGGEMAWPHPQYILLGNALFDIEHQVPLWSFTNHQAVARVGHYCAFVVADGEKNPGALVVTRIPSEKFEKALAVATRQPDFFVLQPGTVVKLNVDSLPDAEEREKVRTTLTRKLQERGFTVGAEGTIELLASTEAGKQQDISYHGFGISPWKSYKVKEYLTRLAFVYQGKTTWQTQGSSVPGFIQLKEGETIEKVLKRSEKPNYAFYEGVELPQMLMKPAGPGGLGTSQITTAGIQ